MKLDNAIKTALEHEAGVHKAYLDAVNKTADETGKRIFRALAEEEMGHIKYLQDRLDELAKNRQDPREEVGDLGSQQRSHQQEPAGPAKNRKTEGH